MTDCPYCGSPDKHDRRVCRMKRLHADPEFAAKHSERMKRLHADPEFAAKHSERGRERMKRLNADPEFNPLAALTEAERDDYDILVKKGGFSRHQALRKIGRHDLTGSNG